MLMLFQNPRLAIDIKWSNDNNYGELQNKISLKSWKASGSFLVTLGLKSDELILPGKKPRCFGGTKVGLSTCCSQLKPRAEEAEVEAKASSSAEWVLKSV
jgi:hypothetical protein